MSKRKRSGGDGLVYSTDHGRMCPDCSQPVESCRCGQRDNSPRSNSPGDLLVQRETKGRKGRTVTVITGFDLDPFALAFLAKELKQKCGGGGTIKDDVIELQGDHVDLVLEELSARGYSIKSR